MKSERIYLSPPHLSGLEKEYIGKTLDSNWVAPVGPDLDRWEQELSVMVGSKDCCLLNSATAALHLSLVLLNVGPGDLVFIQSHTYAGSVYPIIYQGATPVFIDSEPDSWNMSPESLEEAIRFFLDKGDSSTKVKLKAIIPVHIYGVPANMDKIMALGTKYEIPVVEDAAESLGSKYRGRYTGTFGKIGVYSFNGNKIITTSGGGALMSNDGHLVKRARFLATQAREEAPHYEHSETGYNYRLSNVLAGIGRAQMKVLQNRIEARRANFEHYRRYFEKWNKKGYHVEFQKESTACFSNRWLTCILIDPLKNKGLTREKIHHRLEEQNIESRPLWKPMHLQPAFKNYPFIGNGTADHLFKIGLCLPSGSNMDKNQFKRVFETLDFCFNNQ